MSREWHVPPWELAPSHGSSALWMLRRNYLNRLLAEKLERDRTTKGV